MLKGTLSSLIVVVFILLQSDLDLDDVCATVGTLP